MSPAADSRQKMYSESEKSAKKENGCCGVNFLKYLIYIFNAIFWVSLKRITQHYLSVCYMQSYMKYYCLPYSSAYAHIAETVIEPFQVKDEFDSFI